MNRILLLARIFLLVLLFTFCTVFGSLLSNYRVFTGIAKTSDNGQDCIVLRTFQRSNASFYLTVDPYSLATSIQDGSSLSVKPCSWATIRDQFRNTAYIKAIEKALANSDTLQDAGIVHFDSSQSGVNLTIDLCPSKHPLDRRIMAALFKDFNAVEKPVPVGIAISGLWMEEHHDDLAWLLEQVNEGNIRIDWINHSFNHRSSPELPLKENFLLEKGTDLNLEILKTEQKMIINGMVPSVFLRFPGLVSSRNLFTKVTTYGLIPIGSDSWLAKNQWPHNGSIVLIHGNGNEPLGVADFLKLLHQEQTNINNHQWLLFDLRKSIVEENGSSQPINHSANPK